MTVNGFDFKSFDKQMTSVFQTLSEAVAEGKVDTVAYAMAHKALQEYTQKNFGQPMTASM